MTPPWLLPPSTSPQSFFLVSTSMPPMVLMKSAKPSKSMITMWLIGIPRKSSTVLIVEAGLPSGLLVLQASEALIFCAPQSGIAA